MTRALSAKQISLLKRRIYSANYRALREYNQRDTLDLERLLLLVQQSPRCAYCSRSLSPGTLSLDHRIPLVEGGANSWLNIALACRKCNRYKSAISAEEFSAFLAHLGPTWTKFFFSHYRPHGHRRRG